MHQTTLGRGIFSESAREHEIGAGGRMHIASVDELKSEFDPHGAHEPIRSIPEVRAHDDRSVSGCVTGHARATTRKRASRNPTDRTGGVDGFVVVFR